MFQQIMQNTMEMRALQDWTSHHRLRCTCPFFHLPSQLLVFYSPTIRGLMCEISFEIVWRMKQTGFDSEAQRGPAQSRLPYKEILAFWPKGACAHHKWPFQTHRANTLHPGRTVKSLPGQKLLCSTESRSCCISQRFTYSESHNHSWH